MKNSLVRVLCVIVTVAVMLAGCQIHVSDPNYVPPERPHLYWKDIDVVVTDISRRHWFAGTHRYEVNITVESEEYGLTQTLSYNGSGAFGCPSQWNYKEGDIVKAKLYSWVIDSTGEVVKRSIKKIY